MATRPPELYGINIKEIARICHVTIKTATRWKAGTTCPPKSALMLLVADLGCLDEAWSGWRVRSGVLISPEGWEITVGDVLGIPLSRQMIAAYQAELRQIKERVLMMQEQPMPTEWPEWIADITA